jgi:predicted ATPase/class 3 adenylate cyclase
MRGGWMSGQKGQLPTGTVTFLFTDIERSTQTVASVGDERYAEMQDAHRAALRGAFAAHAGIEVQTEGDALFVAFQRASDALDGAVAGQRALEDQPLRVRMGIHTGDALVREHDYVGHEVHRAKRICDAGHGRQILLSETTAKLVGRTELLDLGLHRLKDLGEPQRIYQVGRDRYPALRSLESFTHSLPLQRSAFIGRESEIAEIRALLEANRIVTLTGVGGCGKTRLALQVGAEELDRFSDGVFMVDLAPISDPDAVLQELASAVFAPVGGGGFLNTGSSSIDDVVFTYLRTRHVLLILDNCEHLIDACAEIADSVLARCPRVTILATSREGLRVEGEQTWTVPSLSLPDEASDVGASEAVGLFTARAASVRPDFTLTPENTPPIVEICRRLDGIPLAIEFAAARVTHLSPRQIADRLDDRFRLLTGGQRRVQRQHTLHAALDWSFDLLDEHEQSLLRRLAVFSGHFSVEAVEAICSDDLVPTDMVTDILGSRVLKALVDTATLGDGVWPRIP